MNTWTPGAGRRHPDFDLIMAWAEGKVALVESLRHGPFSPVTQQWPTWNPNLASYKAKLKAEDWFRTYGFRVEDGSTSTQVARATHKSAIPFIEDDLADRKLKDFTWLTPWVQAEEKTDALPRSLACSCPTQDPGTDSKRSGRRT